MVRSHQVSSAEAVAVLARGHGTQYLAPYFGDGTSISQAATELGRPLARVHYWTHRWHDLGLLTIASTTPRKGRPIRRYRTVADEFEVPAQLLPETLLRTQFDRANREMLDALLAADPRTALGGMLRIYKPTGHHNVSVDRTLPAGTRPSREDVFQTYFTAALTSAEAKQLRDELQQLNGRWTHRSSRQGTATHLVMLSLSPAPPNRP